MNPVSTVGLDLAKYIFQLHGADSAGAVVFRKKLRRGQLLAFLATLPPCTVAMEACASAHYWGREIAKLGHTVRLIAPAYVKPFVKRQKNDMADAEAICEAAQRPTMRFVALKSANQQAAAVVFRTRDLFVGRARCCARPRDRPACQGECGGASADDHPGDRGRDSGSSHSSGPTGPHVPARSRFRGLARADPGSGLQRGQGAVRPDVQDGASARSDAC